METQAVLVDESNEERPLYLGTTSLRDLQPEEVLIEVKASGINRADLLQRAGKYPPPTGASSVLGLEVSGVVTEVGSSVKNWSKSDEVFCLLNGGGYAGHVIAPASLLWRKPKDWSFTYAAAIPEGLFTAFLNLIMEGELSLGERVLIEGGSSGIGTFAVQIAKRLGAYVVATAGSEERCKRVKELGANECVNHNAAEPDGEFDLILSIMGAKNFEGNLNRLSTNGRLVMIATQGGIDAKLDLRQLMRKRVKVIGSVLRSRTEEEKAEIKSALDLTIGEAVAQKEIKAIVDSVVPVRDVEKAHARMQAGEHFGKIVLSW